MVNASSWFSMDQTFSEMHLVVHIWYAERRVHLDCDWLLIFGGPPQEATKFPVWRVYIAILIGYFDISGKITWRALLPSLQWSEKGCHFNILFQAKFLNKKLLYISVNGKNLKSVLESLWAGFTKDQTKNRKKKRNVFRIRIGKANDKT